MTNPVVGVLFPLPLPFFLVLYLLFLRFNPDAAPLRHPHCPGASDWVPQSLSFQSEFTETICSHAHLPLLPSPLVIIYTHQSS